MVEGFDSIRTAFAGYEDCYTIIGGTACDILMTEAGRDFRATKDIDMILLLEARFPEFADVLWRYLKKGNYRYGWKSCNVPHFYRFTEPKEPHYPVMIELFSRRPDFQSENLETYLTPLHVSDDISSLSAIMLDDDYYQLMLDGRKTVDGIPVLSAEYLVLFKAKAWIDLTDRITNGTEHVNERDLRKHRGDIFRLYNIVDPKLRIQLPSKVAFEMNRFLTEIKEVKMDPRQYGLDGITIDEVISDYRRIFMLTE